MGLKVRKIGNGFGVIRPKALLDDIAFSEGTLLTAKNRDGVLQMTPIEVEFSPQVDAFLETERAHGRSYRELAK